MSDYKTTWGQKIGYGVGAIGLDLSYGMFYSYLSYYLSSVLGLNESGTVSMTRLWVQSLTTQKQKWANTDHGY